MWLGMAAAMVLALLFPSEGVRLMVFSAEILLVARAYARWRERSSLRQAVSASIVSTPPDPAAMAPAKAEGPWPVIRGGGAARTGAEPILIGHVSPGGRRAHDPVKRSA